jgi:ABC-type nitrate/sulfonate/bicarbonate transport system substrate-binding protein
MQVSDESTFEIALTRRNLLERAVVAAAGIGTASVLGGTLVRDAAAALAAETKATLTFGNFPVFDLSPWYAALKFGYWDDVGINFKTKVYPDEKSGIQAIGANTVQMQLVAELTLAALAPTFTNIRAVFVPNIFEGFAPIIRPNSGMKTYQQIFAQVKNRQRAIQQTCAQVKGKTWLLLLGASFDTTLDRVLSLGGLTRNDVNITNLGVPEGAAAFLNGQGDIYLGDIPHRLALQDKGNLPLITAAQLGPTTWTYPTLVSDKSWAQKNEDTLLRAFTVWYRILDVLAKPGPRQTAALQAMADFVNKGSGGTFTVANAATIEKTIYPVQPTFEKVVNNFFTPGVSTNWNTRLAFAVATRVKQGALKPGQVKPADLTMFQQLFTKLLTYKKQALAGIEKGGPKAKQARALVAKRNYVDAAHLFR